MKAQFQKIIALALIISPVCFAQDMSKLSLVEICKGNLEKVKTTSIKMIELEGENFIIFDKGFCSEFLKQQTQIEIEKSTTILENKVKVSDPTECRMEEFSSGEEKKKTDKWKVRLYASHSSTTYFNSDISLKSSRYNLEIKDYEWAERSSREFFKPKTWTKNNNNPAQMIDEPSNTFTISVEKDGHEFFLSFFHPKHYQEPNQIKQMKGTIDGVAVDGVGPVNSPFDGWDKNLGQSGIVANDKGYRQYTVELGYGYRFNLLKGKYGEINYVPSIGVGIMTGTGNTAAIKKDAWYDFDSYKESYGIQGFGGSVTNRLEINTRKERFGLFYENKIAMYHNHHGFLDGTQTYDIGFMGNSIGMKFMLYNPSNRK